MQRLWDLLEAEPGTEVTVDLQSAHGARRQRHDAVEDSFDIDDYTRWRLLEGLDDIGITLTHDDDIAAFEAARPRWKPVTPPDPATPSSPASTSRGASRRVSAHLYRASRTPPGPARRPRTEGDST